MPVIHFTESDKLAGKVLEKGTYRAILTELKEPQQSSSKKSFTYVATFKLTEGIAVGKKLEVCYNTETSSSSVLGNRQYAPTRDMLKLAAAVKDVKFDDISLDFDSDEILNKPLDLLVDTATSEGNIVNFITGYAPEGKGTPQF
jgi:hypothetical protein